MEPLNAIQVLLILIAFGSGIMAIGYVLIMPFLTYHYLVHPNVREKGTWAWVFGGLCFFAGIFSVSLTAVAPGFILAKIFTPPVIYVGGIALTIFGAWLIWNYARESFTNWLENPFDT